MFLFLSVNAWATDYYVRPDGGTGDQCNGQSNVDYSVGVAPNCAFKHLSYIWAVRGNDVTTQTHVSSELAPGDTVYIMNNSDGSQAEYMVGDTMLNENPSNCFESWTYDCYFEPLNDGTSDNYIKILGEGWDSGCTNPPQLWGNASTDRVLNLDGSDYVEINCLEITDHEECRQSGSGNLCPSGGGASGRDGISAWNNQSLILKNINVHGMARNALQFGKGTDVLIEDSYFNGADAGWKADHQFHPGDNSFSGTNIIRRSKFNWNGCVESYPFTSYDSMESCCGENASCGNSEGWTFAKTQGNFIIEDSEASYNVMEGIDLLYKTDGYTKIINSSFNFNGGNAVKVGGEAFFHNNQVYHKCDYHNSLSLNDGVNGVVSCRAGGDAVVLLLRDATQAGESMEVIGNTISTNGNYHLSGGTTAGTDYCDGTEQFIVRNNVFKAFTTAALGGGEPSFYYSNACTLATEIDEDYNVIYGMKNNSTVCTGANSICTDPKLTLMNDGDSFDFELQSDSPAIGAAVEDYTSVLSFSPDILNTDYNGCTRNDWDIGSLEYDGVCTESSGSTSCTYSGGLTITGLNLE